MNLLEKYKLKILEQLQEKVTIDLREVFDLFGEDERMAVWNAAMVMAEDGLIKYQTFEINKHYQTCLFNCDAKKVNTKKFYFPGSNSNERNNKKRKKT